MFPNNSELSYNSLSESPEFSALNGIVWKFVQFHGFCIMYTKHKNQNGYFKLSEYCEQYERLEYSELYALLEFSDKGSAGLSD